MDKRTEINKFLALTFEELAPTPKAQELRVFGPIWENSFLELDEQLKNNKHPLDILINSGGGSVFDGVAMASLIKRHQADTTATGLGIVASIASVILLSADKVQLNRDAFLMIHNAWSVGIGEADDLRKEANILDKISAQIGEVYLAQIEKSGKLIDGDRDKTRKKIKNMMQRETWLTAKEALELGFIDSIADIDATLEPLDSAQIAEIVNKYGATAPKSFLNMINKDEQPKNETKENVEVQNEASFWEKVKAVFKSNPEKIQEVKETVEQETADEKNAKIENAKTVLIEAGFTVYTEDELNEINNEKEAINAEAKESKDKFEVLQSEYDKIMSKLREFEAEYTAPSSKNTLDSDEKDEPKKSTRESILEELNKQNNFSESKFFKMINK